MENKKEIRVEGKGGEGEGGVDVSCLQNNTLSIKKSYIFGFSSKNCQNGSTFSYLAKVTFRG